MLKTQEQIKERPILFNTEMVKAILEGRKTQTRRVMKPQPEMVTSRGRRIYRDEDFKKSWESIPGTMEGDGFVDCPYGKPGDRLWVRETWTEIDFGPVDFGGAMHEETGIVYRADFKEPEHWVWRPSIHMPRHASRILLEITDIRVERVQEITPQDGIKEGIECYTDGAEWCGIHEFSGYRNYQSNQVDKDGDTVDDWFSNPIDSFRSLWDSINAKRGFGWDVNPWVWVVEFKKI